MKEPIKLKLQPGFFKQGTDYSAAGRWLDGNLVRWHNGVLKTMLGWSRKLIAGTADVLPPLYTDPELEAVRSIIAISDIAGTIDTYFGSNQKIYRLSPLDTVTDVTPVEFVPQSRDLPVTSGYGIGPYGRFKYGRSPSFDNANNARVFSWAFDAWGTWPVACARRVPSQKIYIKKDPDPKFIPIPNSPTGANDILVTDERIIMAIGTDADQRLVSWSDREDYLDWTPAVDNMAGFQRLQGTGDLLFAARILNQVLIVGDNDAFSATFLGPPYVYGFNRIGDNCGALCATAIVATSSFVTWLGQSSFWRYDGTLTEIQCDIWDTILDEINHQQRTKIVAFAMAAYNEIWWLYPSKASPDGECDRYAVYNFEMGVWYYGSLQRTAGVDASPLPAVLMIAPDGIVWQHEVTTGDFSPGIDLPYISTGAMETENGGRLMGLSYLFPDYDGPPNIEATIEVRDLPLDPPLYSRPFVLTDVVSTTGVMGRDLRMTFRSAEVTDHWTLGDFRAIPIAGGTPRR